MYLITKNNKYQTFRTFFVGQTGRGGVQIFNLWKKCIFRDEGIILDLYT